MIWRVTVHTAELLFLGNSSKCYTNRTIVFNQKPFIRCWSVFHFEINTNNEDSTDIQFQFQIILLLYETPKTCKKNALYNIIE